MSNNGVSDDSIQVFIRVRPPDPHLKTDLDNAQILDVSPPDSILFNSKEPKTFTYDRVAGPASTQEEVFSNVGRPIIESCMRGYNGTIFAYGQTGSGKTFTMMGPPEESDAFTQELRGIIPRGFEYLFSHIEHDQRMHGELVEYLCSCSFLEIYNEQVYDLLDTSSTGLHLRENIKRGVYVDGLSEETVSSAKEAYDVLNRGWLNRRVASTSMNRESSRSHAVFTLSIESKTKESSHGTAKIRTSQLNLVDLAGSERQKDTHAVGIRIKEAGSINKSLSALGNVIMALVDIANGKSRHVHYRDSKLTFLLRDSLGGNAKTYLIACVHPSARCYGETLSTLNFARRTKMIKNKAVINEDTTGNVLQLQAEIRKLRDLLEKTRAGIPVQPSQGRPSSASPVRTVAAPTADNSRELDELKNMLQSSMEARDRAETEKTVLLERIQKLDDLLKKKDKFLQSTKFILKLRENHIGNLDKARKNAGLEELQSETIKLLREEVSHLQHKVEHHPDVAKYAIQNIELKNEVKKLREACVGAPDMSRELSRAHHYTLQLEKQIRHFLAQNPDISGSLLLHSMSGDSERGDLQEQCKKLQAELSKAQHDLLTARKASKQQVAKLEGNLNTAHKANAELERTIDALKLKNVIERDTLNDMHMKTIREMLTPSKGQLKSSLSTVNTPASGAVARRLLGKTGRSSSLPASPSSSSTHDKLKLDQLSDLTITTSTKTTVSTIPANGVPPSQVDVGVNTDHDIDVKCGGSEQFEVSIQGALTDELKVLQENTSLLQSQLDGREEEVRRLQQVKISLESESEELRQLLEAERESAEEGENKMMETITLLTAKVAELTSSKCLLDQDVKDLRLRVQTLDEGLAEQKQTLHHKQEEYKLKREELEGKVQELELGKSGMASEVERATEQLQSLQNELETLNDELSFKDDKLTEYTTLLQSEKHHSAVVEGELQTAMEKLSLEVEKNMKLNAQIETTGDSRKAQQELMSSVTEISSLKAHVKELEDKLIQQYSVASGLEQKVSEAEEKLLMSARDAEANREAMSAVMSSLQEQKTLCSSYEAKVSNFEDDLKERSQELQVEQDKADTLKSQLEEKDDAIKQMKVAFGKQLDSRQLENDMLSNDVEDLTEENQQLRKKCKAANKSLAALKEQLRSLKEEDDVIEDLTEENEQLKKEYDTAISECAALEKQLRSLQKRSSTEKKREESPTSSSDSSDIEFQEDSLGKETQTDLQYGQPPIDQSGEDELVGGNEPPDTKKGIEGHNCTKSFICRSAFNKMWF
jgi:kinesin family protein 15